MASQGTGRRSVHYWGQCGICWRWTGWCGSTERPLSFVLHRWNHEGDRRQVRRLIIPSAFLGQDTSLALFVSLLFPLG